MKWKKGLGLYAAYRVGRSARRQSEPSRPAGMLPGWAWIVFGVLGLIIGLAIAVAAQ